MRVSEESFDVVIQDTYHLYRIFITMNSSLLNFFHQVAEILCKDILDGILDIVSLISLV